MCGLEFHDVQYKMPSYQAVTCTLGTVNFNSFQIGSDRSVKLCEICIERHLEVIACDILAVPLREGVFDAAICIAVIHHLSTVVCVTVFLIFDATVPGHTVDL